MITGVRWRRSSRSGGSNNCVEVAGLAGATVVRDSKDRCGGHLVVSESCWRSFLSFVKADVVR